MYLLLLIIYAHLPSICFFRSASKEDILWLLSSWNINLNWICPQFKLDFSLFSCCPYHSPTWSKEFRQLVLCPNTQSKLIYDSSNQSKTQCPNVLEKLKKLPEQFHLDVMVYPFQKQNVLNVNEKYVDGIDCAGIIRHSKAIW